MLRLLLTTLAAAFVLAACESNEGPAERAGEKIDEAMDDAGDSMEDARDTMDDVADEVEEAAEDVEDELPQ